MLRWVRLLLVAMALVGILTAGPGGALAGKAQHHHHCMDMASDDCPGDDLGGLPACCIASVCAMVQPVFVGQACRLASNGFTRIDLPLRDDVQAMGVRVPPDLRPPIA
jgi:hypothetical protein